MDQLYDPPVSTAWFQFELDAICRDRGCQLRISWAPRLTVARVIQPDGSTRDYAKYPILFGGFHTYSRGNYYVRFLESGKFVQVAYQPTGTPIPPNVLQSDIALPHLVTVNYSIPQFVIERKFPDESARRVWEEKTRIARDKLGFDLFGPFPKEGVWDWFDDINQHHSECCDLAAQHGVRCVGLYREPDNDDLIRIRQAVKEWIDQPRYIHTDLAAEAAGAVRAKEILVYEERALLETLKEVREARAIDQIAHSRSRVAMGVNPPRHRREY